MAKIEAEIISARYDLKDEDETQYDDSLMLDYYNRARRLLGGFLARKQSDWVVSFASDTLSSGTNSISVPQYFSTPIEIWIDTTTKLTKKTPLEILKLQQEAETGDPSYFAISKTNIIFEKKPTADKTINIYYNSGTAALVAGSDMPYNDEFNDSLRGVVVMMAKSRNNKDIIQDHAIFQFFEEIEAHKILRRKTPDRVRTPY